MDGRPKRIKKFAFTSVCVYNRLRVDGTLVLTTDKQTKEVIFSSLLLKAYTCNIFISPNRVNLKTNVVRTTKKKALSKLDWLVTMCLEKGVNTQKTILFRNTMKDVASLVNYLM